MSKHRIYLLKSHDIFRNLAFEDALYQTVDLRSFNHFLLWRSNPCVVIGRHQNPWWECRISELKRLNIPVARRNSGGGAVFHDLGNLNLSFMSGRKEYDKEGNLQWLAQLLRNKLHKDIRVSKRSDLVLGKEEYKVSGSSSKLGKMAYLHCTLLFSADLKKLSGLLNSSFENLETNATSSVKSPVSNLNIDADRLVSEIIRSYEARHSDVSVEEVCDHDESKYVDAEVFHKSLLLFKSWEWIYGRSPRFQIKFPNKLITDILRSETGCSSAASFSVNCTVNKGIIEEFGIAFDDLAVITNIDDKEFTGKLSQSLIGTRCIGSDLLSSVSAFEMNWDLEHLVDMRDVHISILTFIKHFCQTF